MSYNNPALFSRTGNRKTRNREITPGMLPRLIREIQRLEGNCYRKITDLYARCSQDYAPASLSTKNAFSALQNKLLWAITRQTAAEIISCRADADQPQMGLCYWKNGPLGKITRADTYVAKNYLRKGEYREIAQLIEMFLEYAEKEAEKLAPSTLEEWNGLLDMFLEELDYPLLPEGENRNITRARRIASQEYDLFKQKDTREFTGGFKEILMVLHKKGKAQETGSLALG